ncbi:MAG TPA: hypothetical protein VIO95_05580, partial [Mycobacterium sp.]
CPTPDYSIFVVSIKTQPNGQHVAAPASPLAQLDAPAQLPAAKSPRAADDSDRYQLHVVATTVADVVTSIGGLIFDRAMAGWDVTVAVDGDVSGVIDDLPLRILGARVAGSPFRPHVLAVATDVFVANEPIRRLALAARKGKATDVLLWGRRHPPHLNRRFVPVRHRPSAAALVFKSHALAGRTTAASATDEGFYSMG